VQLNDIVIAVDFSPASLAAARWVAHHLAPKADLTLVYCLEMPRGSSVLWEALPPREKLLAEARRGIEARFAKLIPELGEHRVRTEILVGPAAEEIGVVAREIGTQLVVTGDHQGPHETWRLLGTTAEQLVATCRRPVLVARNMPEGPPRRLLVPVDESELSAKALGWAVGLAERLDAEVIAYHVVTDWYYQQIRQTSSPEHAQEVQERLAARAQGWLGDFIAEHVEDPSRVRTEMDSGRPRGEALGAIERLGADLVVIGTHGLESVTGEPQKRLSRFLLVASPTSVLVLS